MTDRMWRIGRRGLRNDRLPGFWLGKTGCIGCHDLRYKTLEEKQENRFCFVHIEFESPGNHWSRENHSRSLLRCVP